MSQWTSSPKCQSILPVRLTKWQRTWCLLLLRSQLLTHWNWIVFHMCWVFHFIYIAFLFIWFSSTSTLYCGSHVTVLCAPLGLWAFFSSVFLFFRSHTHAFYVNIRFPQRGKSSSLTIFVRTDCYLFLYVLGLFYSHSVQ